MFKTEFERLCTERKTSPTAVCLAIGLSNSAYTQWTDTSVPRKTTLMKIEKHLSLPDKYFESFLKKTKKEPTTLLYSGNERIDSIAKTILNTDLTDDDLKLIEFILDKYKK